MPNSNRFVLFLRGINVGGHKKVPMAELRDAMTALGFQDVVTLLNTGNVIFTTTSKTTTQALEDKIEQQLASSFGFAIPAMVQTAETLVALEEANPFAGIELTTTTRLYASFLKTPPTTDLALPWTSADGAYRILAIHDRTICSVLDLSVTGTIKGMDELEQRFGKEITTRNWNTLQRVVAKL